MTEPRSDEVFTRLVTRHFPGCRMVRHWPLTGGISAETTAIEVAGPDTGLQRYVVRRHGEAELRNDPRIAANEFRLLQLLHATGIPVPEPYAIDESGETLPTPYIVMAYIDGLPVFAPSDPAGFTAQLAEQLARIHSIGCDRHDLSFLPRPHWSLTAPQAELADSSDEARIRAALAAVWPLPECSRRVLLHGDFWPGNVLWKDGRLAAIIDWEDASTGDPLADVAIARMEILWACGAVAMASFTDRYQQLTGVDLGDLPCWDLFAALRPVAKLGTWGLPPEKEQSMRAGLHWFIDQALAALEARKAGRQTC